MTSLYQPIITFLSGILSGIDSVTGDWGIAIILLTLTVKTALYRFNLTAARQSVRTAAMQPKLKELRTRYASDQNQLMQESMKLYQTYGVRPLAAFAGILVQMPVLASMYRLFLSHGAVMSSHLVPWVAHLAQADSLHLLPLTAAALAFLSGLIPITSQPTAEAITGGWRRRAGFAVVFAAIPLLITWRSPVALGIYWITGTLFGLLEKGFYRTAPGKRLLTRNLPEGTVPAAA